MFFNLDQQSIQQMCDTIHKEQSKLMEELRDLEDVKQSKKLQAQINAMMIILNNLQKIKNLRRE
jgi:cell fate (sporulation/competence/biofilm development) regulator YmcA (YheA/YmcA/DUF963 family)